MLSGKTIVTEVLNDTSEAIASRYASALHSACITGTTSDGKTTVVIPTANIDHVFIEEVE